MENDVKVCCICGKKFTGWGNNPWPIVDDVDAICCDTCNDTQVIQARLVRMYNKEVKND